MSHLAPILLSLRVASLATACTFVIGLGLAWLLWRRAVALRFLWESLIYLPLVFPPTITGYILLLLLGKHGPLGRILTVLGIQVIFSWGAAVIASVVVSLPLMYQSCKTALLGVDGRLQDAARTLGFREGKIFRRVTFPLALPGIIAGSALSFARALGEFGATLLVAGNIPGRTQTIPLALYSAIEGGRDAEANLYLLVTTVVSFGLIDSVGIGTARAGPAGWGRGRAGPPVQRGRRELGRKGGGA